MGNFAHALVASANFPVGCCGRGSPAGNLSLPVPASLSGFGMNVIGAASRTSPELRAQPVSIGVIVPVTARIAAGGGALYCSAVVAALKARAVGPVQAARL